jgi:hypothetical protein
LKIKTFTAETNINRYDYQFLIRKTNRAENLRIKQADRLLLSIKKNDFEETFEQRRFHVHQLIFNTVNICIQSIETISIARINHRKW